MNTIYIAELSGEVRATWCQPDIGAMKVFRQCLPSNAKKGLHHLHIQLHISTHSNLRNNKMENMEQGVRSDLVLAPGLGTTISNLAIAVKTNQPDKYDQESLTRHRRQHLTLLDPSEAQQWVVRSLHSSWRLCLQEPHSTKS